MARQPEGPPPPPVVQRLRVRYAKRGRLRFTSHRDFARAFERALRRAAVPMAYSAGFTPHPKISYLGAAPTGVASEAEYLEIGLAEPRDPEAVGQDLDNALPAGLDIVEVVEASGAGLADRIEASWWRIELADVPPSGVAVALERFLALESAPVERATKDGRRTVDARAAVVAARLAGPMADSPPSQAENPQSGASGGACATIELVVRHVTPAVRPDDVVTALREAAALSTPVTPMVTRLAQGLLSDSPVAGDPSGALPRLIDPLASDTVAT